MARPRTPHITHEGRTLVGMTDAAERIGVSTDTIRRRIATGDLTGYRLGARIIRVDLAEVDALLTPMNRWGGGDAA